jgi:hypothetical protein
MCRRSLISALRKCLLGSFGRHIRIVIPWLLVDRLPLRLDAEPPDKVRDNGNGN